MKPVITATEVGETELSRGSAAVTDIGGEIYLPQHDSWMLIEAVRDSGRATGARVADLCTGTGIVARACAELGAESVTAIDSSAASVAAARRTCRDVRCHVRVEQADIEDIVDCAPFDVVTCNPPYVPTPDTGIDGHRNLEPRQAWSGGEDGRAVLDKLCTIAHRLLRSDGTLLLVQSEFANVSATLRMLAATNLHAEVVATRVIPFGPVLNAHSAWFEDRGLIEPGRRTERLAVIRATPEDRR